VPAARRPGLLCARAALAPSRCGRAMSRASAPPRANALAFALLGAVAVLGLQCGFVAFGSTRPSRRRRPSATARRADGPLVQSSEVTKAGDEMSERYEKVLLAGRQMAEKLKKKEGGTLPKMYFIGPAGNSAERFADTFLFSMDYTQAPGYMYLDRPPTVKAIEPRYSLIVTDKELSSKARISPPDLYVEDEDEYRELETQILREFAEQPNPDGIPMGCVVGESAVTRPENLEIMKDGLVIWFQVSPDQSWLRTQTSASAGAVHMPSKNIVRPPVWAIANGWDGDVDDGDARQGYKDAVKALEEVYEGIAKVRLRTDVVGIVENSMWGADRLVKAVNTMYGFTEEEDVEEVVLVDDLEKFLESARLSKYFEPAKEWCEEQGAASIEDIVENAEDFAEALSMKPLERKRLNKAAAAAVVA